MASRVDLMGMLSQEISEGIMFWSGLLRLFVCALVMLVRAIAGLRAHPHPQPQPSTSSLEKEESPASPSRVEKLQREEVQRCNLGRKEKERRRFLKKERTRRRSSSNGQQMQGIFVRDGKCTVTNLTQSTLSDASDSRRPPASATGSIQSSECTVVSAVDRKSSVVTRHLEDPSALRGAYLWYRLVRYAVLDRGRADFQLSYGCEPALLASLVARGWIALDDALRWADARTALGEGLLELAAHTQSKGTNGINNNNVAMDGDKMRRPTEAEVLAYRKGWLKTMPSEQDLTYDWRSDRAHRRCYGPLGPAIASLASAKVLENIVRKTLASPADVKSTDTPRTLQPVLQPILKRSKYISLGRRAVPKPAVPLAPVPPVSSKASTSAQPREEKRPKKEQTASRPPATAPAKPVPAPLPPRSFPPKAPCPPPLVPLKQSVVPSPPPADRSSQSPGRKQSLQDYTMSDPPEYSEIEVASKNDMMDIDSPAYRTFDDVVPSIQNLLHDDVEMLFVGMPEPTGYQSIAMEISMSPPPQYATLAPDEQAIHFSSSFPARTLSCGVPIIQITTAPQEAVVTDTTMTEPALPIDPDVLEAELARVDPENSNDELESHISELEARIKTMLSLEKLPERLPPIAEEDEPESPHPSASDAFLEEILQDLYGHPAPYPDERRGRDQTVKQTFP